MNPEPTRRGRQGPRFTLIEFLIVVAVVATLAATLGYLTRMGDEQLDDPSEVVVP